MERRLECRIFRADPEGLYSPLILNPVYGYQAVNVQSQKRSEHSLLSWMQRMIRVRNSVPAFGRGSIEFLYPANHRVLAYVRQFARGDDPGGEQSFQRRAGGGTGFAPLQGNILIEMFGRNIFPRIGDLPYLLTMGPYQFYWFRLRRI